LSLTFVPVPEHPSHDPAALADRFGGIASPDVETALASLPAPRLVAGSLYLAGDVLRRNGELPD
jgi:dihydrofolate synthase/folylpolyglutamate synthase